MTLLHPFQKTDASASTAFAFSRNASVVSRAKDVWCQKEREHPESINGSRRKRIADGSGTSLPEVNRLLKQFEGTRKVMKGAATGNLMQRMGAMGMRRH